MQKNINYCLANKGYQNLIKKFKKLRSN